MKKVLWVVALMAIMTVGMRAQHPSKVPAYRGLIERVQPNGDTLHSYLRGDERSHFMTTEDGWQIMESNKGWYKYAKTNRKGEAVISNRKAHNKDQRSKCENRWLEKHGIKKHL